MPWDTLLDEYGYERGCVSGNSSNEAADHSPAIREAQADGSVTAKQDPEVLARFLVNAWEGAIVGERAAKDGSSFAAFFTLAFGTLLR